MGHPPLDPLRHNRCRMLKHSSDNTPSMKFYEDTNSFYCFGCKTAGSNVDYVMGTLPDTSIVEAVILIEKWFNLTVVRNPTMFRTLELKRALARLTNANNRATYDASAYAQGVERKLKELVDNLGTQITSPEDKDSLYSEVDLMYHDLDMLLRKSPGKETLDSFLDFYMEKFSEKAELVLRTRGEL